MKENKYLILIVSLCLTSLLLISCQKQTYLKAGDDCFDKGDYLCAKQNYTEQKSLGSEVEMNKKIERCDSCLNFLALANFFFANNDYLKAKEQYEKLLMINSKDQHAIKQLELCDIPLTTKIPDLGAIIPDSEITDAAQQNARGAAYYNEKNYTEAVNWYRKSAEQGNASGQANLGYMYRNGYGVTIDYTESLKWYRKSAEQGDAIGQVNLGYMYRNGFGVAQDYTEAVKWYLKSAEQGNPVALRNMGVVYENGYGVTKDDAEAVKWYRKSVEQGDADGQVGLGNMYFKGAGVEQDYVEAFNLFRKSAEQGNVMGQFNMALMYEIGVGVQQDKAEAIKWYTKASESGHANAKNAVERLSGN